MARCGRGECVKGCRKTPFRLSGAESNRQKSLKLPALFGNTAQHTAVSRSQRIVEHINSLRGLLGPREHIKPVRALDELGGLPPGRGVAAARSIRTWVSRSLVYRARCSSSTKQGHYSLSLLLSASSSTGKPEASSTSRPRSAEPLVFKRSG